MHSLTRWYFDITNRHFNFIDRCIDIDVLRISSVRDAIEYLQTHGQLHLYPKQTFERIELGTAGFQRADARLYKPGSRYFSHRARNVKYLFCLFFTLP